jgi:iron complex outermembrane receptor protein
MQLNYLVVAARAAAGLLAVSGMPAQSAGIANAGDDAHVIVTATRFQSEAESSAAIGTQIISSASIRASGAVTVVDALKRLGGVHARISFFGTPDEPLDLRGFGITGDQNAVVLLDGVRLSENELASARLAGIPIDTVERIEILRGGGTVLYGPGATAGVINIITRAPVAGQRQADLRLAAASGRTSDARASGAIAGDSVGVTFASTRTDSQNYRDNNATRQHNTTAAVRWFGTAGELGLRVASERLTARLPGALFEDEVRTNRRQSFLPLDYADTDANRYTLHGKTRIAGIEFAMDAFRRERVTRAYLPGRAFGGAFFDFFSRTSAHENGVSPRARAEFTLAATSHTLVGGFDESRWRYRNISNSVANDTLLESATFDAFSGTDEAGTQRNRAWYIKDEIGIGNSLRLSAGLRRESARLEMSQPFSSGFGQNYAYAAERSAMGRELAASFAAGGGWTIFAHGGTSFRIANVDENRGRSGPLDIQSSRDINAGARWRSARWQAEARLFRSRLENEIAFVSAAVIPPFGQNINLPPTERSGLELDARWIPDAGLDLSAGYQWVDARFRSGAINGLEVAGRRIPVVPRQRAWVRVTWRIDAAQTLNAGARWVGEQVLDNDWTNGAAGGRRLGAYQTFDVRYAVRRGPAEFALSVDNLFNSAFASYAGVVTAGASAGRLFFYPDALRTLRASIGLRF